MSAFPAAWLFVPGNRPERFAKAAAAGAEAIILDLEDAVAPDQKDTARLAVQDYLAARPAEGPQVAVRMNPLGTVSGVSDLVMLARTGSKGGSRQREARWHLDRNAGRCAIWSHIRS